MKHFPVSNYEPIRTCFMCILFYTTASDEMETKLRRTNIQNMQFIVKMRNKYKWLFTKDVSTVRRRNRIWQWCTSKTNDDNDRRGWQSFQTSYFRSIRKLIISFHFLQRHNWLIPCSDESKLCQFFCFHSLRSIILSISFCFPMVSLVVRCRLWPMTSEVSNVYMDTWQLAHLSLANNNKNSIIRQTWMWSTRRHKIRWSNNTARSIRFRLVLVAGVQFASIRQQCLRPLALPQKCDADEHISLS